MKHNGILNGALASLMLLGGCATFSNDGGLGDSARIAGDRLGKEIRPARTEDDARAIAATVANLLSIPLGVDDAVQIALLRNPGLQATYAELGIAEADLVQAGRLHNPGFSFKRTRQAGDVIAERTLTFNLIELITMPIAARSEARQFEVAKLLVADQVLGVASDTRRAYFQAVAAQQSVKYAAQVNAAAEAGADLAARMAHAGNWSSLEQAREQTFHAEATAALARANKAGVSSREKLVRLMGLAGNELDFQLPDRLPDLPAEALDMGDAETFAMAHRLDIQAAKQQSASVAASLGLSRTTRFVNALDLGVVRNTETGRPAARGYEISVEIPLFDWGEARVAKTEAIYMQSVNRLAETSINARSEVRERYAAYHADYKLARHYRDHIVPLRKKISEENLLRYNGMLIGVFELLADSREQVSSVSAYIDALRDYWIAETELAAAMGGQLPTAGTENKGSMP